VGKYSFPVDRRLCGMTGQGALGSPRMRIVLVQGTYTTNSSLIGEPSTHLGKWCPGLSRGPETVLFEKTLMT
jgi:hypothetical protein